MRRLQFTFNTAAAALCMAATICGAQEFPSKPIRMLASEPGGSGDFVARTVAQGLTGALGQQVLVENRGGGVIAGDIVAKSPPDGYTLLVYSNVLWLLPLMRKDMPYDPYRDFAPVTLATRSVNVLVVHPSLPVRSVKDLIALARTQPGNLNYSSGAAGATNHLAAELFKSKAKLNITRVPYRGAAPAITAVVTGEVQMHFASAAAIQPHLQANRVRPLAVTAATRSAQFPSLPTVAEGGLPGFEAVLIYGIFAPARTPEPVIGRLNKEIVALLQRPESKARLLSTGVEAVGSTPAQFAAAIKDEVQSMGKVIRDAGIQEN